MQLSTIFALSATVISQCAAVRSGILDIQFNGYGDNLTYGSYNVSVPLNGTIVPIGTRPSDDKAAPNELTAHRRPPDHLVPRGLVRHQLPLQLHRRRRHADAGRAVPGSDVLCADAADF